MGYVVDRRGCGVFMMPVENHGPLQFGYHLKILAFMCKMQWDVKIYGRVKQICSFNIKAFFSVIVRCTNQMISLMLDLSSSYGICAL